VNAEVRVAEKPAFSLGGREVHAQPVTDNLPIAERTPVGSCVV